MENKIKIYKYVRTISRYDLEGLKVDDLCDFLRSKLTGSQVLIMITQMSK